MAREGPGPSASAVPVWPSEQVRLSPVGAAPTQAYGAGHFPCPCGLGGRKAGIQLLFIFTIIQL